MGQLRLLLAAVCRRWHEQQQQPRAQDCQPTAAVALQPETGVLPTPPQPTACDEAARGLDRLALSGAGALAAGCGSSSSSPCVPYPGSGVAGLQRPSDFFTGRFSDVQLLDPGGVQHPGHTQESGGVQHPGLIQDPGGVQDLELTRPEWWERAGVMAEVLQQGGGEGGGGGRGAGPCECGSVGVHGTARCGTLPAICCAH